MKKHIRWEVRFAESTYPKKTTAPLGRHPGEPTDARVGSMEKLEVMRGRYLRGEAFFHCDDSTEAEPVDGTGKAYQQPVETQSMRFARGAFASWAVLQTMIKLRTFNASRTNIADEYSRTGLLNTAS